MSRKDGCGYSVYTLPLPDSVNKIVSVHSWLSLAFFRPCNLTFPHWRDYKTALVPASSTQQKKKQKTVYTAFIVYSHNIPRRTDEDGMQIPHPKPWCHLGRRFRAEGQSVPMFVCVLVTTEGCGIYTSNNSRCDQTL